jgi:hypothetical protein
VGDEAWGEYRMLVLAELKRLTEAIADVKEKIDELQSRDISELRSEIAILKLKSGMWGLIAGAIPGMIAALYVVLSK